MYFIYIYTHRIHVDVLLLFLLPPPLLLLLYA